MRTETLGDLPSDSKTGKTRAQDVSVWVPRCVMCGRWSLLQEELIQLSEGGGQAEMMGGERGELGEALTGGLVFV